MVDPVKLEEENHNCHNEIPMLPPHHLPNNHLGKLAADLNPLRASPSTLCTPKNVVIVIDGLREFNLTLLVWALENIVQPCCTVTILSIFPWLNIPLQTKIWLDYWAMELQDLSTLRDRNEWRGDAKHLKIQAAIDLCKKYGAVPRMKVAMGYPLRLVVVEQIARLQATWVVFDRHCGNLHNRRMREYYKERIPCNMVIINNKGEADLIKSMINREEQDTLEQSPSSLLPAPMPVVIISEEMQGRFVDDRDVDKDVDNEEVSSIN